MPYKHTITSRDTWFLDKHMKDPITQELFKVGDAIVICAKCKTAHYDSTWGMNSNKCCSMGCNHNIQLFYNAFSSTIFQPKATHSSKFNILTERLPFLERLKLFNGYPLTSAVTVLIPVIIITLLVYSAQYQAVPAFSTVDQLSAVQNKFIDLGEINQIKLTQIIEEPKNSDIDLGNTGYKINAITSSFDNVKPKLLNADIGNKFEVATSNFESRTKQAGGKLSQFFGIVSEFLSNLFGG